MTKKYDYCCKNCWHMWKTMIKAVECPECKSKDLDEDYEIII